MFLPDGAALCQAHPNVSPGASCRSGVPFQSLVFLNTVFPHHVAMVFSPIRPFSGYCKLPMSAQGVVVRMPGVLATMHMAWGLGFLTSRVELEPVEPGEAPRA